jgi:hypothetical protein
MRPFQIVIVAALGVTTCACSGASPAAQPTHTITVTARPPASRVSATPSAPSNSPSANCLTKDLSAAVGSPQGYSGGLQVPIVFQNTGSAPCSLYGYPGVAQAAGTPITNIGQPSTGNAATPRQLVTLPSGGFASAMLRIANSANYPAETCKPVKATWLAVIPPNEKTALNISFGSTACGGNVRLLSVSTVQQGSAG